MLLDSTLQGKTLVNLSNDFFNSLRYTLASFNTLCRRIALYSFLISFLVFILVPMSNNTCYDKQVCCYI